MARKKAVAIDVPATQATAQALLADYVMADRRALELALGYQVQIDRLKSERDAALGRIADQQKGRFASLKAWWEAGGKALAGKGRSAELAGAKLGLRLSTPAMKLAKGITAQSITEWLSRVVGGAAFLRTKIELDKQAVIKALQSASPMAGPLGEQGVTVVQTDEFFIDTQLDEAAILARLGMAPD